MDRQSLEDLLALINVRNLSLAARQRHVSQSAFSRRLQAIEQRYGVRLFDRSRRPAQPSAQLDAMKSDIELSLSSLARLEKLLTGRTAVQTRISIAGMHSLTATALPMALKRLGSQLDSHPVRMRSANRDGCFQMLMTGEVNLMVSYETTEKAMRAPAHLVSSTRLCSDYFIPVCSPDLLAQLPDSPGEELVPLLAYPVEVFLGRILNEDILPRSPLMYSQRLVAGMTNVLLTGAIHGLGVAWLPASTTSEAMRAGQLRRIENPAYPSLELIVTMLRLRTPDMAQSDSLLDALGQSIAEVVADLQHSG